MPQVILTILLEHIACYCYHLFHKPVNEKYILIVTSFADGPITRLFQTKNVPLFPVYWEWGRRKGTMSPFFYRFVQEGFPKIMFFI